MTYIFIYVYGFCAVFFGIFFSGLFFYFKDQKKYFEWSKKCVDYENSFNGIMKDLERELTVRKNLEKRLQNSEESIKKLLSKLAVSEERLITLSHYRQEHDDLNNKLRIQREVNIVQQSEIRQMSVRLEEKELEVLEKSKLFFDFEKKFSDKFENLANRVFEYNGKKVDERNISSLEKLLSPLRMQIDNFTNQVRDSFSQEERERHTLSHEIHHLQQLNLKITQETVNLTQALKGNNKVQGNWGEVILNRVLEASGMREGYEFHTQACIHTDSGRRLQPDVIVHLPNNKDIIIDAKTSLLDYEKYFNASTDRERQVALLNHVNSVRTHIKALAKKDYHVLYSVLQTLDYILMFVPIEAAFMLALDKEPTLLTEAIEHNIMLVSPTTLLVALRIIDNLWRYEHQNQYAKEIADRASYLYNKLRLFVDDFSKVGQCLDRMQNSYSLAKNKLFVGSGNIISQAEKFRVFGVKINRPIISDNKISSCQFSSNQISSDMSSNLENIT